MRVGVLGGTLDPVHLGHLVIAEEARQRLALDRVIFVPAGKPWLKEHGPVAPPQHRLQMVRLAVERNPFFSCSPVEIERRGVSYTVDTLEELRRELPSGTELFLILGSDWLHGFHRWRRPERIMELATLVAVARPGCQRVPGQAMEAVAPGASERVVLLEGPLVDISSTEIRRRVAEGLSIRHLVPPEVEDYITRHGLYRGKEAGT